MSAETRKNKKINLILLLITFVLAFFYILSFTKSCSSTDKREIIKTALVNKKNADKITMFQLQGNGEVLTLSKKNNNWFIIDNFNQTLTIPADNKRIENFINDLITIQNMYKISDNITENNSFGLTDSSAFYIRYYYEDGFNDIIFGNQDFALSSRYMMSGKSTVVYEIPNKFDKYLSTSVQSWTEPYIISKSVLGEISASDIQRTFITYENKKSQIDFPEKLLDLRHGGLPESDYFSTDLFNSPLIEINAELGNKNQINLKICQSPTNAGQDYFVEAEYINSAASSTYKSYSKISSWTYNKIKEITL